MKTLHSSVDAYIDSFPKHIQDYTCSHGAIQFPLDKPLPVDLIKKVVEFRKQYSRAIKIS